MVREKTIVLQVSKYEEFKELKETEQERLVRESYEMEFGGYNSIETGRGYGPCLTGDISSCRCSKEELERQKALIELQREREKLEAEREQREEERNRWWHPNETKRQEIERKKACMKAAWDKWEEDKKAYLLEQDSKFWGRDSDWREKFPKPPSDKLDDY